MVSHGITGGYMRFNKSILLLPIYLLFFCFSHFVLAKMSQSEAPYFQILPPKKGEEANVEALPLQKMKVKVEISGVIAHVTVDQVFQNRGEAPIEAIYLFPGSTKAAVHAASMTIGKRVLKAKIEEKGKARKAYENAKSQGKIASLLEQHRPNVFQMNVANILPGDLIKVTLQYTELLVPENGEYSFVYPTVVGPRYSKDEGAKTPWVKNPYITKEKKAPYSFQADVSIQSPFPIDEVSSPTHSVNPRFLNKSLVNVKLKKGWEANRDFIVKYRISGDKIQSGFLSYEEGGEKYFLAMVQTPEKIEMKDILPREYIFVVDVSGSMRGFPLNVTHTLMEKLLAELRPSDSFNVILFATGMQALSKQMLEGNSQNIKSALEFIRKRPGGGGTRLLPALTEAVNFKGSEEKASRIVTVVTDGYIDVEKQSFDIIRDKTGQINVFPIGIGSSVNRYLIEGLARVGQGKPFVALNQQEATQIGKEYVSITSSPVLGNVTYKANGISLKETIPVKIPDLYANKPIIVYGKYTGKGKASIQFKGQSALGEYSVKVPVTASSPRNKALKYLWAREKIANLDDYAKLDHTKDHKKEITQLGLKYSLLTQYTSFIAIDSEVRNIKGKSTTVTQPLPLPKGVSPSALQRRSSKKMGNNYTMTPSFAPQAMESEAMADSAPVKKKVPKAKLKPKAKTPNVMITALKGYYAKPKLLPLFNSLRIKFIQCLRSQNALVRSGLNFFFEFDKKGKIVRFELISPKPLGTKEDKCMKIQIQYIQLKDYVRTGFTAQVYFR